jgi:hypothetical protein
MGLGLLLFVLLGGLGIGIAQDKSTAPPKVLVVMREFLKPGKAGSSHEKTESAFVQAFRAAKWPTNYLGMDSLSGKPRSLFFEGYDSFAAWEKDQQAQQKNATMSAAVDRAGMLDGELQSEADSGVFIYREDLSLRAPVDLPHMRYFEISLFVVKPGHEKEFEDLGKMYVDGFNKVQDAHWATFQSMYGQWGSAYLVITPMKSAKEVDDEAMQFKQLMQSLGDDGMKKLGDLSAASIESTQTNLFMFNPRESYVSDDWMKADSFWKPAMAKKETKTGQ